jgi:hypothetical protein
MKIISGVEKFSINKVKRNSNFYFAWFPMAYGQEGSFSWLQWDLLKAFLFNAPPSGRANRYDHKFLYGNITFNKLVL